MPNPPLGGAAGQALLPGLAVRAGVSRKGAGWLQETHTFYITFLGKILEISSSSINSMFRLALGYSDL